MIIEITIKKMIACKHGTLIRSCLFKSDKYKVRRKRLRTFPPLLLYYILSAAISRTIPALVAHKIETRRVKDVVITRTCKQGVESHLSPN